MTYVFEDLGKNVIVRTNYYFGLSDESFATKVFNMIDERLQYQLVGRVKEVIVISEEEHNGTDFLSVLFCSDYDFESVVVEYRGVSDFSISRIGKY